MASPQHQVLQVDLKIQQKDNYLRFLVTFICLFVFTSQDPSWDPMKDKAHLNSKSINLTKESFMNVWGIRKLIRNEAVPSTRSERTRRGNDYWNLRTVTIKQEEPTNSLRSLK